MKKVTSDWSRQLCNTSVSDNDMHEIIEKFEYLDFVRAFFNTNKSDESNLSINDNDMTIHFDDIQNKLDNKLDKLFHEAGNPIQDVERESVQTGKVRCKANYSPDFEYIQYFNKYKDSHKLGPAKDTEISCPEEYKRVKFDPKFNYISPQERNAIHQPYDDFIMQNNEDCGPVMSCDNIDEHNIKVLKSMAGENVHVHEEEKEILYPTLKEDISMRSKITMDVFFGQKNGYRYCRYWLHGHPDRRPTVGIFKEIY